jgi:hypothetical protein
MAHSAVRFYFLRESRIKALDQVGPYLGGRPRAYGVRYATAVNTGKKYPYSSKRQNTRELRKRLRAETALSAAA